MGSNKKILVTGATGFVGRHLVADLVTKGHMVYIVSRQEHPDVSGLNGVQVIVGDINDPITLPTDVKTIYHCAGVIRDREQMEKVNVIGTQNIVDLAIQNDCTLTYLGSAGVAGNTDETNIDEHTLCRPQNDYEISKYKGEQIVLKGIQQGLKAHILRPVTIFGVKDNPDTDSFFHLIKSMRSGRYKNIGHGIYNIVHVSEVVKALQILEEKGTPYGNTYIISNAIAYKDMDILVKDSPPAVTKKTQTIPYPIAIIITAILTICYALIHKKSPLTFSRLRALTNTKIYSQKKLLEDTPFKNSLPVEEYLKIVCKSYIERGFLR